MRVGAYVLVSQREPHACQGRRLRKGPRKEQNVRSARKITLSDPLIFFSTTLLGFCVSLYDEGSKYEKPCTEIVEGPEIHT